MTVVGIDISTTYVHTAWLENGKPMRWHCHLGKPRDPIQDRVRAVRMQWPTSVAEIAIEYPYGPNREGLMSMMAVIGAVTKSAPTYCRVAWISSQDLRKAIGASNTKESAHLALAGYPEFFEACAYWTPDELDALTACIGWTNILAAQDAA